MVLRILIVLSLLLAGTAVFPQSPTLGHFLITGQVLDVDGNPIEGAHMQGSADWMIGRAPIATTNPMGKFSLEAFKAGRWMLTVEKSADGYPSTYNSYLYPDQASRPYVVVPDEGLTPPVTIRLARHVGSFKVQLADSTGEQKMFTNVRVTLCRVDRPNYCFAAQRPSSNGSLAMPASGGRSSLMISADGYEDWFEALPLEVPKDLTVSLKREAGRVSLPKLAVPEVIAPRDGAELFITPRILKLEWAPVPGAASYGIDLDVCAPAAAGRMECKDPSALQHPRNPPTSGIIETSFQFVFLGAQPGRWRVWAVDAEGRPGRKTKWQTFFSKL